MKLKYLSVLLAALSALATMLVLTGSVTEARTKKGDKLLKDGRVAEAREEWDKALELYEQAVDQDPADVAYLGAMRKARFEAGQKHVENGQKLRDAGKVQEAAQEFQKAIVTDPSSAIALQELKRLQDTLKNPNRSALRPEDQNLSPAERERRRSTDRVESMLAPPELKPMTLVIPSLKMNNQPPRVLYETVGKLAGLNVVFDSQYNPPARNFNVDLTNATPDQAFDYLALLTHTFWKPIASNAVFVTEDNVTKRRDYEDDVVKVFYVTNATSVQEFQEIATAIRTVAEIRRVFTYNAQRAMIVRDTVDKVALAEKLVHDLDKPKAEVVVDVYIMQTNTERVRDLAATIASMGSNGLVAGLNLSAVFQPGGAAATTAGGTTAATTIPLSGLGHIALNQFQTSLPGALLQAMLTDTRTKVMNNPQVRASDGQKVTLKIGQRIPYATGSFQTNTAAALVSTQFNYADVGVNIDMTPQVHSSDEVTLHVEVTVSSEVNTVSIGGINQPIIGQQSNIADIRLREGEVNIMGGLSQTSDSTVLSGLPWLTNIPVLGRLFGSEHLDKSRGDLVVALIPHIVRTPDYSAENLRGIYAGTDQVVKLNYAPKSVEVTPAVAVMATPGPAVVGAPAANIGNQANPAARLGLMPGIGPVTRLSFVPGSLDASAGAQVPVQLRIDNANGLASASPLRLTYPAGQLRLDDVTLGDVFSSDGAAATIVKDIRNDTGEAALTINRPPGSPPVSGSGIAVILKFTATGAGSGSVKIADPGLKNAQGQPILGSPGELAVTVR